MFHLKFLGHWAPWALRIICKDRRKFAGSGSSSRALRPDKPVRIGNLDFWGRVGLAAGFDKDGELLRALPNMGFHFAEVGTVTPRPQPGNDKPRLFRLAENEALFNRMGFNNRGGDHLREKLQLFSLHKPWYFRVGVNIGKNKDTPNELAANDYALLAESLAEYADYFAVNVSSPNTPGLRDLQNIKALETLIRATRGAIKRSAFERPLLLKLGPELEPDFVQEVAKQLPSWGGQGLILTNTLAFEHRGLKGGLSGRPLKDRSREALRTLRKVSDLPVISVGGIDSAEEAQERLKLGADLLQIYSAWIFKGPRLPSILAASCQMIDAKR